MTILETYGTLQADGTLKLEQTLAGGPRRVKVRVEEMEESDEEFARRFSRLAATWKEEIRHSSKIKTMREAPAYREIVGMGDRAVPLILARLEKNNDFSFLALEEITGHDPLPNEKQVNHNQLADAWLAWGRAQGHRWEHVV